MTAQPSQQLFEGNKRGFETPTPDGLVDPNIPESEVAVAFLTNLDVPESVEYPPITKQVYSLVCLLNTVDAYAEAVELRGLKKAGPEALGEDKSAEAEHIVKAAGDKSARLFKEAKQHFAKAIGLEDMLEEHQGLARQVRNEAQRTYAGFLRTYVLDEDNHGVTDPAKLRKIRKKMNDGIKSEIEKFGNLPLQTEKELGGENLDHAQRLEVLLSAEHAGFEPSTRKEANMALSYLDYIQSGEEHDLGIVNQLFEVVIHQQGYTKEGKKIGGAEEAHRAVESITWEIGDFAIDAATAIATLSDLQQKLPTNPNLELNQADPEQEEFDADHPALAYVFQHFDTQEYMRTGSVKGLRQSPTTTKEYRLTGEDGQELTGNQPGKHKIIYSKYTSPERSEAVQKHFQRRMGNLRGQTGLTVVELKNALPQIIDMQQKRLEFMLARLGEINAFFGSKTNRMYQGINRAVQDSEAVTYAILSQAGLEPQTNEAA